jgi:protein phosphatase
MKQRNKVHYDTASALIQGGRDYQEDAVVADFPLGSDLGVIVLSDGMGGHAAGDIASKIVMTEVYSELKFQSGRRNDFERYLPEILATAANGANECILAHVEQNPEAYGMGATLVSIVISKDRLNWISVGDSPLFLFRDGELRRLNEDHSLGPQIDMMVETGMMDPEVARTHPDRNALTSVLSGDDIQKVDCPKLGLPLNHGDVIVAASDGLEYLSDEEIAASIAANVSEGADKIAEDLIARIETLDDPDQDNMSLGVVKVHLDAVVEQSDSDMPVVAAPAPDAIAELGSDVLVLGDDEAIRQDGEDGHSGDPDPIFVHTLQKEVQKDSVDQPISAEAGK